MFAKRQGPPAGLLPATCLQNVSGRHLAYLQRSLRTEPQQPPLGLLATIHLQGVSGRRRKSL